MTDFLVGRPADRPRARVLLAHGSGAPMDSDFMVGVAERFAKAGAVVARFEFPYMAARRTGGSKRPPNRLPQLQDAMRAAAAELSVAGVLRDGESDLPLVLAGKSLGGRVASTVADELDVAGLVCLGYPFHPPGKPDRLRTDHLVELRTPTLVLQGERDRFGGLDEVDGYELAAGIRIEWVPDGDHGFVPRVRSGHTLEGNLDLVGERFGQFLDELCGSS